MNCWQDRKFVLLLVLFYLACFVHACVIQFDPESLLHFVPDTPVESVHSAKMSYLMWNARIGELASYFIGDSFREWIMVMHPLLLTLAVVSLYRLTAGEWPRAKNRSWEILVLIALLLVGMHSGIDWFIGNLNWLYPCSIALFFFAMTDCVFAGDFSLTWARVIPLVPLALIIGMSNENTAIVSLLFFGGAGIYWKWKNRVVWGAPYTTLLLTLFTAALVLYCAPARAARSAAAGWEFTLANLLHNCVEPSNWGYFFICFWRPFLILAFLLLWKPSKNRVLLRPRYVLVGLAFFMMWGVLLLTPCWGAPRAYCPMEMMLIVLISALFQAKAADSRWFSRAAVLLFQAAVMATIIWPMLQVDWARYQAWCHVEKLAQRAKTEGRDVLVVTQEDVAVYARPVSQLWKIPHSFYPYKAEIGYLAIPDSAEKPVDYFERTLPQWREAPLNRPLAKRLGLRELHWEESPRK